MLPSVSCGKCHPEPAKDPMSAAEPFGSFVVPPPTKMSVAWEERNEVGWSSGLGLLEMDGVTEGLEATHGASDDGLAVALIEVGLAEVLIGAATSEEVVASHQDAVTHRDDRPLLAAACRETSEQSWQVPV